MNYLFLIITLAVIAVVLFIASFTKFRLTNEGYDRLKWIVIRWSYIVVFIALVAKTFKMPYGLETVAVVTGFGAMLAGLMGISNKNYNDERVTNLLNADLLKDMLGFDEDMHLMGELESEDEEDEESEE